jgi:hypothetical protein
VTAKAEAALKRVRKICLALPDVNERASHGAPTFFIRDKRSFLMFHDNHHGDGRLAIWCAAPAGMQEARIEEAPDVYFRPPYVGHRGWLGIRLDRRLPVAELAGAIEDAYESVDAK